VVHARVWGMQEYGGGGVAVDPYVEILAPLQSGECNILGRIMFCNDHVL
jgi:hypothetical protein